jgi:hypothetical protein
MLLFASLALALLTLAEAIPKEIITGYLLPCHRLKRWCGDARRSRPARRRG